MPVIRYHYPDDTDVWGRQPTDEPPPLAWDIVCMWIAAFVMCLVFWGVCIWLLL